MAAIPVAAIVAQGIAVGLPLILEGALRISAAYKASHADIPDEERRAKITALDENIKAAYEHSKELARLIATDTAPAA